MNAETSRVMDALPGMVWTALPDGSVEFVNHHWCESARLVKWCGAA